ncbi:cytochrome P450 4c3-like [Anopheles ziemanni]|uniref:cytochrome P450 4c3-like n=1 Tax=Anopheles coustani TaxID=139045 RepID=UPI002659BB3B|nr:cytochrome P450 4c3-like [Anopheles coustani]XP_058176262.1 cytochrome P450 4c3-like [Anopheles ziemanni]
MYDWFGFGGRWTIRKVTTLMAVFPPVTLAMLAIVFLAMLAFKARRAKMIKLIDQIPGPVCLPLVGNGLQINVGCKDELFDRIIASRKMFGRRHGISRVWNGPIPYVLISKASAVEPILSNPKLVEKSNDYEYMKAWLGNGLLTSPGHIWHPRRKSLTPAFHFKILSDFVTIFQNQADVLIEKLGEQAQVHPEGFNIVPYVTLCALDIFCETAMGCPVYAQQNANSEYVRAHKQIGQVIRNRLQKIWLHPDFVFKRTSEFRKHQECLKVLHTFSDRVVRERKEELRRRKELQAESNSNNNNEGEEEDTGYKKKQLAFLDLLLEGSGLSDLAIREEVDTFIIGGHDTTAAAMAWILYLLGADPAIQERAIAEIDAVMGGDRERRPTMAELNEMKYLECCIKEGLRLYPSIPVIGRRLTEDVRVENYTIPAGTTAMIVVYELHRDATVFSNPDKFNPDNFLPESCAGRHPYAYIPFSAGPRNCIGQKFAILEEKSVISAVLRKYRVEAVNRREDVQLLCDLVLRPKDGLRVRLHQRT